MGRGRFYEFFLLLEGKQFCHSLCELSMSVKTVRTAGFKLISKTLIKESVALCIIVYFRQQILSLFYRKLHMCTE
jgi:hypothetical protein